MVFFSSELPRIHGASGNIYSHKPGVRLYALGNIYAHKPDVRLYASGNIYAQQPGLLSYLCPSSYLLGFRIVSPEWRPRLGRDACLPQAGSLSQWGCRYVISYLYYLPNYLLIYIQAFCQPVNNNEYIY